MILRGSTGVLNRLELRVEMQLIENVVILAQLVIGFPGGHYRSFIYLVTADNRSMNTIVDVTHPVSWLLLPLRFWNRHTS